ncbi:hypothetical protein VKT23_008089 [Stygiomarasmius scandens]|uniref:Arrestin C-terminal-like domain-containing protein n=1 Tax=Marasmiellus scandens TaxID=2682957 RepID=A0ABR1JKH6_9AGAR
MASKPLRPEPMNVTTNHPKVKLSLTLASPLFVAGDTICGKMEMDCRADKGLGIGLMMVELFAFQELHSRDHSATSNFIHTRRFFQGPGLPPSNAVQPHPQPGDPPLPPSYHQARRGHSTFLFRLPLPHTSPSSISFGNGLADVRYEVRASVGVSWKGERRVVTEKKEVEVVEGFDEVTLGELMQPGKEPEGVVVGEAGKIWMQGRIVGGVVVAGEVACVELQVKNHSSKKNTGLSVTLSRILVLPDSAKNAPPLEITDTLTTVPFKGPEYIIPPGAEGVASLVFDVPRSAKGVKGGVYLGDVLENLPRDGEDKKVKESESLFEVRCIVGVKMSMGLGSKDIFVEIPVAIIHPAALPELPPMDPQPYPFPQPQYGYPGQDPYYAQQQAYHNLPPPHLHPSHTPGPYAPPYPHPSHTPAPYAAIPPHHTPTPGPGPGPGRSASTSPYPPLPMSPPLPGGVYVDPSTNMVWLPPPVRGGEGYEHGGEYQGEYYVPPIPPFHDPHQSPPMHAYDPNDPYAQHHQYQHQQQQQQSLPAPPMVPPRPSSAGGYHTQAHDGLLSPPPPGGAVPVPVPAPVSVSVSASSNGVPGLPPASATPGLSALGFGSPSGHSREKSRARSVSPQRSPSQLGNARGQTHRNSSAQSQGQGQGQQGHGRGRGDLPSAPTAAPELPRLDLANIPPPPLSTTTPLHSPRPVLSPKQSFTRVTTITPLVSPTGQGSLSPNSAAVALATSSSSPGIVSPGGGSAQGGAGGAGYFDLETHQVSKSERVEELERMADEVGRKKKDLSGGTLPRDSVLALGLEGSREVEENVKGKEKGSKDLPAPPVPTMSDKERFKQGWRESREARARARADEFFAGGGSTTTTAATAAASGAGTGANGAQTPRIGSLNINGLDATGGDSTPPTPATPTLMAVASRKDKDKDKLGATKKEKELLSPSLSPGLGLGAGLLGKGLGKRESGLDALEAKLLAEVGTRKVGTEKKPDVWSVLGQSRTDVDNKAKTPTPQTEKPSPNPNLNLGSTSTSIPIPPMKRRDSDVDPSLNDSAISSLTLPDCGAREEVENEGLVSGVNGALRGLVLDGGEEDNDHERERDRDSDEKSQKTHKGRSSRKDREGSDVEKKKVKKRKSREKGSSGRGKEKAAAAKGRVAAWLGNVEADIPPAEDVIEASPSPEESDQEKKAKTKTKSKLEGLPSTSSSAGAQKEEEEELSVEELLKKEQAELDKADPPKPGQSSPNPRSSGFVPIGTLKRDIYQRTLVPKDSPYATTNNPVEDAKKITDLWSAANNKAPTPTLKTNKDVSPPSSPGKLGNGNETLANNPWQSVRSPLFAGRPISGGGKLPMYPPPPELEQKYDIRSARGGRGGKVTAVAAIWASGVNKEGESKRLEKIKEDAPKPKKLSATSPKLPVSATSSTSSLNDSNGIVGKRSSPSPVSATAKRPAVKSASIPAPTVISSSHATPTLSSTASLARPSGQISPGKTKHATKVPLTTISELPSSSLSEVSKTRASFAGGEKLVSSSSEGVKPAVVSGVNKGSAAAGLKALAGSGPGPSTSKRNSMPASTTSTSPPPPASGSGEMAFGQARLRDLIKKYQGQKI